MDREKQHRQERLARTRSHAERRLRLTSKKNRHDRRTSLGWFKKGRWQRHACSKKRHGRPKLGRGACHYEKVRPTVEARHGWRRLLLRGVL